jgi:NAD(P)-dependent dehydrogenase (short-subunit alcohol dehydrogenase family)
LQRYLADMAEKIDATLKSGEAKRIVITGVSRGIGNGFARRYLADGHFVYGTVRDPEAPGVRSLRQQHPDRFIVLRLDVREESQVREALRDVAERTDGIELLINNAGVAPEEPGFGVLEMDPSQLGQAFDVNVLGPLRMLKAFYPLLRQGRNPRVVMISSVVASMELTRGGREVPYCVSKAALNMLTLLAYYRLREDRIPIVALHPGWVKTDMGGSGAQLSVDESVSAMVRVIDQLNLKSPVYLDYRGKPLPW